MICWYVTQETIILGTKTFSSRNWQGFIIKFDETTKITDFTTTKLSQM